MLVSLADYRDLTDDAASDSDDVTRYLERYQWIIEGFLDRQLEHATVTDERHNNVGAGPLALKRYPITAITSITADGEGIDVSEMYTDADAGLLWHNDVLKGYDEVLVTYDGGYAAAPNDMAWAICALVQAEIAGETDGFRAIKKEVVYGVQSIDYGDPSKYGTHYPQLGHYATILERYKRPAMV